MADTTKEQVQSEMIAIRDQRIAYLSSTVTMLRNELEEAMLKLRVSQETERQLARLFARLTEEDGE